MTSPPYPFSKCLPFQPAVVLVPKVAGTGWNGDAQTTTIITDSCGMCHCKYFPYNHNVVPGSGPQHLRHVDKKHVHFSRVVQVREIVHRKNMSPTQLLELWDTNPEISDGIFDFDHADLISRKERELKRGRKREAYMIRMQFLSDWEECRQMGVDLCLNCSRYSQISGISARYAHNAAIIHSLDLQEESCRLPTLPATNARKEVLSEWCDVPCRRRSVEEIAPCLPTKRLRLTI
jgi:hypothetical protein